MYNFNNLSDEKLRELGSAVYAEERRRFLLTVEKYPKLLTITGSNAVEGIKAYREAYQVGLSHAHALFKRHHRSE